MVVAQELIHSLDKLKGKVGFMAIKVDLVKAYDRLKWSFIRNVLKAFQFPDELIKLIMSCVTFTTISILLNGGKLSSSQPTRGIRQGDPSLRICLYFAWSISDFSSMKVAGRKRGFRRKLPNKNWESHTCFLQMTLCFLPNLTRLVLNQSRRC